MSPSLASSKLVLGQSSLLFILLYIVSIDLAVHDAGHLGVDLHLILLANLPSFEGVHNDEVIAVKEFLVFDTVATSLEEVVLNGVVIPDGHEAAA